MKKLSLDLGALAVESFDATPRASGAPGTVRGNGSFTGMTTFTETLVQTTTDPNQNCMCQSGSPCVNTLQTACPIDGCEL